MSRKAYTDADRALVYAELEINQGNIKRTARNLDMPISTVRYFKNKWQEEGVPNQVVEALPAAISSFVEDAERIRDKLLLLLEAKVDSGDISAREIVPALGMLVDKIRAIRGLDTKKVEHTLSLPKPEEVRELFAGVFEEVVGAAQVRASELEAVEEGEFEPVALAALNPPSE